MRRDGKEAVGGREVVKEEKGWEGRVEMGRSGELKRGGGHGGGKFKLEEGGEGVEERES